MKKKKINFQGIRQIPILFVAEALGLQRVHCGGGNYAMKEGNEVTSLIFFTDSNKWKRFSGKDNGTGITGGDSIDLVRCFQHCELRDAVDFLTTRFL